MSTPEPPELHELLAHQDWLRALARRLVSDAHAADDLAQDALVVALERPPRHGGNLRAWLARVLRNLQREGWRRQAARPASTAQLDPTELDPTDAAEVVTRAELAQLIGATVLALAEPYRSTVLLRHFDGLTPRAIAARQGVPVATVTSRLTRAHALLRARLDQHHGGDGRTWTLALLPLLAARRSALASTATVLVMGTPLKLLAAAALVVCGALLFPFERDAPAPSSTAADGTHAEGAPASAPHPTASSAPPSSERESVAPQPAPTPATPTPQLAGVVRTPDGAPAAGATVMLGALRNLSFLANGTAPGEELPHATTDDDGRFAFDTLPPGRVDVTAGRADTAPSPTASFQVDAEAGPLPDLELTLRVGARIDGEVLRPDGRPARGWSVRFMQVADDNGPSGLTLLWTTTTDADGRFQGERLRPGEWGLVALPSDEDLAELGGRDYEWMLQATVPLADGDEERVVLGAPSEAAVEVSGQVRTKDGPVGKALLQWMAECEDPMASQVVGHADEDGRFAVVLPEPGRWWVRALGGGLDEDFFVDVPEVEQHTLDLVVPSGELRGFVYDSTGAPLADVAVSHIITGGAFVGHPLSLSVDRVRTGADGAFRLRSLGPGRYQVGAGHLELGVGTPRIVDVGPDEIVEGVDFTLSPGVALAGRLLGPDGDLPAARAAIWIVDANRALLEPITQLATKSDGSFRTPPLPPGDYGLVMRSGTLVAHAGPLAVGTQPGAELELQLAPGGSLVVAASLAGEPVRAQLQVFDDAGRPLHGLRTSWDPWTWKAYPNDSLRRHIGPLPAGRYEVRAVLPGRAGVEVRSVVVGEGEESVVELAF